jgi:hypothetical protein
MRKPERRSEKMLRL